MYKQVNRIGFPFRFNDEIILRRKVQEKFNQICLNALSSEIEIPLIEPLSTVIGNGPKPLRESHLNLVFHGLVFYENLSLASAVRYEASSPIAEVAAAYDWNHCKALRFHYMQEMVRLENSSELSATRCRSFFQMGHERFTGEYDQNIQNLAESIAMMLEFFKVIGLPGYITISHTSVSKYGLQSKEVDSACRRRLIPLFECEDSAEAYRTLAAMALPKKTDYFLKQVLRNKNVTIEQGWDFMKEIPELQSAAHEIKLLLLNLEKLGVKNSVLFDAGLHRSLNFYSGIVFQAHLENVREVAGGGDFSISMQSYECPRPIYCSGFAIGYERIAFALKQQDKKKEINNVIL